MRSFEVALALSNFIFISCKHVNLKFLFHVQLNSRPNQRCFDKLRHLKARVHRSRGAAGVGRGHWGCCWWSLL